MTTAKPIGISIIGGTGYGAGELLRLLTAHPDVQVCEVSSRGKANEAIASVHPHLNGFYDDLRFTAKLNLQLLESFSERFLFLAIPHKVSGELLAELAPEIKDRNIRVIDLSGTHRLKDPALHNQHYAGVERSEELVAKFTYGLSECFAEEIVGAEYIANPGCLATASILSLAPIATLLSPLGIAFDTKTGSSGSGRELRETTHHPSRHADFVAYKPLAHRHEPEVLEALQVLGLPKCETSFIAQSLPIARGIYVTTHVTNETPLDEQQIRSAFEAFCKNSPFVRLLDAPPHIAPLTGTNFCDIAFAVRGKSLVVMVAIDNLVKGMTGQAIQNMNLMSGRPQETGIMHPGMRPY